MTQSSRTAALTTADDLRRAGWTEGEPEGFIGLVGPVWVSPERPMRRFAFVVEEKHRNRGGVAHGGMLMTFADRALGVCSRDADPTIVAQSTVTLTFDFMDPAEIGALIEIDCEVMRRTRTLSFMRGTLTCAGRVIGTASGIWRSKREPAKKP